MLSYFWCRQSNINCHNNGAVNGGPYCSVSLACYTGHQNKCGHLGWFDITRQTRDWFICQLIDIWHILLLQICKAPWWLCSIKKIKDSCVTWILGHQKIWEIKLNHISKHKVSISKRDLFSCLNNQYCCHVNVIEYRNRWSLIYMTKWDLNVIRTMNLSNLVTNNLLFNKSLKIQDSCLLGPLIATTKIARITFLSIFNPRVLLQTWPNKFI